MNKPNHIPYYTSPEAASAAGVSLATLKNWASRKPQVILMTEEERDQFGRGHPILYSRDRVVQIAITARLVALGWQPPKATTFLEAVKHFVPTSDVQSFLVARGGRWAGDEAATLINVTGTDAAMLLRVLMDAEAVAVLNLNALVSGVEARLVEVKEAR